MPSSPVSEAFTLSGYNAPARVPTAVVALAGGCLVLLTGTFLTTAVIPSHQLERGFAYTLVPSVLAAALTAWAYERHPRATASVFQTTTGVVLPTR